MMEDLRAYSFQVGLANILEENSLDVAFLGAQSNFHMVFFIIPCSLRQENW